MRNLFSCWFKWNSALSWGAVGEVLLYNTEAKIRSGKGRWIDGKSGDTPRRQLRPHKGDRALWPIYFIGQTLKVSRSKERWWNSLGNYHAGTSTKWNYIHYKVDTDLYEDLLDCIWLLYHRICGLCTWHMSMSRICTVFVFFLVYYCMTHLYIGT